MKRLEKVLGYSYGSSLEVKVFKTPSHKRPFEIEANNIIVARTDTEDKARMYVEAFIEGFKAAKQ